MVLDLIRVKTPKTSREFTLVICIIQIYKVPFGSIQQGHKPFRGQVTALGDIIVGIEPS